jgi:hypothetical protein
VEIHLAGANTYLRGAEGDKAQSFGRSMVA